MEEEMENPYWAIFDQPDEPEVDEDDLRWGLALPEGWKHREPRR